MTMPIIAPVDRDDPELESGTVVAIPVLLPPDSTSSSTMVAVELD